LGAPPANPLILLDFSGSPQLKIEIGAFSAAYSSSSTTRMQVEKQSISRQKSSLL